MKYTLKLDLYDDPTKNETVAQFAELVDMALFVKEYTKRHGNIYDGMLSLVIEGE